jgi:hypothetical protein
MAFIFILLNLLMIFSSHLAAYRFMQKSNFSEQLITAFLIYISQITFSVLFLGVVIKNLSIPFILILNVSISLFFVFVLRKMIKESIDRSYQRILDFFKYLFHTKDFFLYLFLFLFITQVLLLFIKIYYLPPYVWDTLQYHLHPVVEWKQQNMIPLFIDTPVGHVNNYPLGSKLLHFWFIRFFYDITWIELPQFIFGIFLVIVSYAIMRKMTIKRDIALRYAILIYFIPSILIESRTCQDHVVLTGMILITMFYFIDIFFMNTQNQRTKKTSNIIPLSLSLGILLGTKISSPHIIFIFLFAILLSKGFSGTRILKFFSENRAKIVSGFVIIFFLGSFWFLKSKHVSDKYLKIVPYIVSKNFLFIFIIIVLLFIIFLLIKGLKKIPTIKRIKKKRIVIIGIIVISILGSYGIMKNMGFFKIFLLDNTSPAPILSDPSFLTKYPIFKPFPDRFVKNILSFPFRIKDVGVYLPYSASLQNQSGFGVQFFSFGLIAYMIIGILFIVKKEYRKNMVGFIFIFSIVLLGSYFLYYYSFFNYRLFMFFPIFGIILWSYILHKFDLQKYYLKFIDVLILIMILFNLAACFYEGKEEKYRWKTLFTMNNSLDRTSIKYSSYSKGDDWEFIDEYLNPEEPIGYVGHPYVVFQYFDNQLKRNVHFLPSLPGFRLTAWFNKKKEFKFNPLFKKSLKQRNIHFLHINFQHRHFSKNKKKTIFIEDRDISQVAKNLYYFKW